MVRNFISKSVIKGSNIFFKGELFHCLKEISRKNDSEAPFDLSQVKEYLKFWNINQDISDVPLMGKEDIRRNTEMADPGRIYKTSFTGGSTGEPLRTIYSKKRFLIRTASMFYYNQLAGYNLGDSFLLTRSKDESWLKKFLKNETIFVPNDLSKAKIKWVLETIVEKKIKVLIGYPSVFFELALSLEKNPAIAKKIKVKTFISSAEPVENDRLVFISKAFNCQALDRYANEENGILAHQRIFGGNYLVDRYNFYIEVLDPETLLPVKEGMVGKVVVTDVFSDLVPIIRYDTGDFAEVAQLKNGQVYSIRKIIGRVVDQFFKTNGDPLSPLTLGPYIRLPLTNLGILFQFQFAQKGVKDYELRLKVSEKSLPEKTKSELINGLKSILGNDATITINHVKDIPARLSGKRPLYINECTSRSNKLKV